MGSPSFSSSATDLANEWANLTDEVITPTSVEQYLRPITDDLWVSAACLDRLLEDVQLQRGLLELGLSRTEHAAKRTRAAAEDISEGGEGAGQENEHRRYRSALVSYFQDEPADAQLCCMRIILLNRLDRLNTFVEVCKQRLPADATDEEDIDGEWADDPWGDGVEPSNTRPAESPLPLSSFLSENLLDIALLFASSGNSAALRVLLDRHSDHLWPHLLAILDSLPEHIPLSDLGEDLLVLDATSTDAQGIRGHPWRPEREWVETNVTLQALAEVAVPLVETAKQYVACQPAQSIPALDDIVSWYRRRIDRVVERTGIYDTALSLSQHGASQGVLALNELAEDIILMSRLVYDVPVVDEEVESDEPTFEQWKDMDPSSVINIYLSRATPDNVAQCIRKLVMPYLFVLESRAERDGHGEQDLGDRLLYDHILEAPLEMVAAIFEASKPTLAPAQRLLRKDEDMARLALACLYGSESLDEWSTMSRIFECLPAWDASADEEPSDVADTTLIALSSVVGKTGVRPQCTPKDLLLFFKPLPSDVLSRILDVLDMHLESGEVLARWGVAAPLRWFLRSNQDPAEQRARAIRMARRGVSDETIQTIEDWEWILEDMLKLSASAQDGHRGAFCLLSEDEVKHIFLNGLLASGKFDIAHALLNSSKNPLQLENIVVEEVCLACSREFYDNASSGNYHFGDMKLAYDCLGVSQPTEKIVREKDFIEATSRLCAFNLMSQPGVPVSPIEIRLTKDRLSLVSRVLSSNADAYKHTQVILDLVHKLGLVGAAAEVKTLAMLTDAAMIAEDFDRAYETNQRMLKTVLQVSLSSLASEWGVQEINEVCWLSCYQLGRHPEFEDTTKKRYILSRAAELCPAERLVDTLASWRALEQDHLNSRRGRQAVRKNPASRKARRGAQMATSMASRLQRLRMPTSPLSHAPDAAAFANKAFQVAAHLPFSVGARGRALFAGEEERSRSGSRSRVGGPDVSAQAGRVLQKGLGWLLGEDD